MFDNKQMILHGNVYFYLNLIHLHIDIYIAYQYLFHFVVEDLTKDGLLILMLSLPLYFSDDEIFKLTTFVLK